MRRLLPLAPLLAAALAPPAPAQPSNDECAGAIPVVDGTNPPDTNSGSTTSSPPWSCGAGLNDVWYAYAASCTGIGTFSFCTGTANYDAVLEVFSGTCAAPNLLACNDDFCPGLRSQVSVPVSAGSVYLVRVGGNNGEVGTFALSISCSPATLPNDECAGAIPISDGLNPSGSNAGATTSAPPWSCGNGGNDVWFSYAPTCTDSATFTFCPGGIASYDSVLEVFSGSCGALVSLACNDDAPGCGLASEVTVPVAAGSTYLVRVGGFSGNTGTFQLYVHHGGSYGFVGTGCGSLPITPSGLPDLGQAVSFDLGGVTGAPAIWVGLPANVPLCPPSPCAIGATFLALFAGSASLPATIPCDATLVGATLAVQGADVFAAGGCSSPVPFTLSNTVLVTIG
ncbi:MAG TPA: hypothetical protein VFI25_20285 [Planctomycetota bacterium]|jgi:hypothetical protein|nr:hypothetical protein [Planctomycetota bacterium]